MHYFTALVISEAENIGFIRAFTTSRLLGFLPDEKGFLLVVSVDLFCVSQHFDKWLQDCSAASSAHYATHFIMMPK